MDTVIVIIPVYNVQEYLADCVNSVINQTYKKIAIILVDDGSEDASGKICDEYKSKDSRITVIHKTNGGLSSARNVGIQWAIENNCGEWICFVDSDDWVHPQYVEALLCAANKNNSPVSVCQYVECQERVFEYDSLPENHTELWSAEDAYTLRKGAPIAFAVNKFCRLDCYRSLRFPEGKYFEDIFTTYKVILPLKTVPVVNYPLYYYFRNPNGIVRSEWSDKHLDFYEAHYELLNNLNNYKHISPTFFRKTLEQLVFILFDGFRKVKKTGSVRADGVPHYKIIQSYARKTLKHYNKNLTKNEKIDLLRIAYPSVFERMISLKNKYLRL